MNISRVAMPIVPVFESSSTPAVFDVRYLQRLLDLYAEELRTMLSLMGNINTWYVVGTFKIIKKPFT